VSALKIGLKLVIDKKDDVKEEGKWINLIS
jgi:hypothetical protein